MGERPKGEGGSAPAGPGDPLGLVCARSEVEDRGRWAGCWAVGPVAGLLSFSFFFYFPFETKIKLKTIYSNKFEISETKTLIHSDYKIDAPA